MPLNKGSKNLTVPFKNGDRVLCINDDFRFRKHKCVDIVAHSMIRRFPERLEVYTVRYTHKSCHSIFLAEFTNPILINAQGARMEEPSWAVERFIKLPKQNKEKAHSNQVQLQLDLFLETELSNVTESIVEV